MADTGAARIDDIDGNTRSEANVRRIMMEMVKTFNRGAIWYGDFGAREVRLRLPVWGSMKLARRWVQVRLHPDSKA